MKPFLLAATVAAGLFCSANTADAQFRRGGVGVILPLDTSPSSGSGYYSYPAPNYYVYPMYSYDTSPTYTYRYYTYPSPTYTTPNYSSSESVTREHGSTSSGGVYTHPNGWATYTYPNYSASPGSYTYPSYPSAPSGAYRLGGGVWHW